MQVLYQLIKTSKFKSKKLKTLLTIQNKYYSQLIKIKNPN